MQPLEKKMEQQQEQLEQNEEMEQAQEQEQLEETPQDDAPEGAGRHGAGAAKQLPEGQPRDCKGL